MYRVMLVDSERSFRRLLRVTVDWKALDMEIVGEADNGAEAVRMLDSVRPDLCLMDVDVPYMGGLRFAQLASERYPELMLVVITSNNDFETARQCISLPVFEYLMKPVGCSTITDLLVRMTPILRERSKKAVEHQRANEASSIERIVQHLQDNYTDSRLNLTSVAQTFGFSPSYLSRKFKIETGKSFIEFLTECRMAKAIEMAKSREKMFCTANAVGIPDPNYFGRCFKKFTGQNYSQYDSYVS